MPSSRTPTYQTGQLSDRGQHREANEDSFWATPPGFDPAALERKGALYLVADGMGGHQGGQRASQLAVSIVPQMYYGSAASDVAQSLRQALQAANDEILREARSSAALYNMGTTAVAAVILGNRLVIAHVGDSRAYRLRGGKLELLTNDHSFVEEGIRRGQITQEDAATHPYRGVITRALGAKAELQPEITPHDWQPGDQLLLCSDGLSGPVAGEEISNILRTSQSAQQAAQRLIDAANQRGGPDNITAIVVSYNGSAAGGKGSMPLLLGGVAAMAVALLVAALFFRPNPSPPEEVAAVTPGSEVVATVPAAQDAGQPASDVPAASDTQATVVVEVTVPPTGTAGAATPQELPTASTPSASPAAATAPPAPPTPTPLPAIQQGTASLPAPQLQGPDDGDTMVEQVVFRWVSVPTAAGYRVETRSDRPGQTEWRAWDPVMGESSTAFALTFANNSYFTIPGTVYFWRVAALDGSGNAKYSQERRFVMQMAQPPTATPPPPPTAAPTQEPTPLPPTEEPTAIPTQEPTPLPPTEEPSPQPSQEPPLLPSTVSQALSSATPQPLQAVLPSADTVHDTDLLHAPDLPGPDAATASSSETIGESHITRVNLSTDRFIFLPVVEHMMPLAPLLSDIENPEGSGSYSVHWSPVEDATYYELEEANNQGALGASRVYSGTQLSFDVTGRGASRYFYRVRAGIQSGQTAWSDPKYTDVLWEAEPNNVFTQANGPLVSGLSYRGQFEAITDLNDYFKFELTATHAIEVRLTNIAPGENYDLVLRNDTGQILGGYSGQLGNADETIALSEMPAGRYYVRVFNRSVTVSQRPYQLTVVYE